jgi:hypothetical protein
MYLNRFSVRIGGGVEDHSGYVRIKHNTQYSINLRNDWRVPAQAVVRVDGKEVGIFKVEANSSLTLQRPVNDDGRFTFFRTDSREAEQSGVQTINKEQRGLVQVEFTPAVEKREPQKIEYHYYWHHHYDDWYRYPKVTWGASYNSGTSTPANDHCVRENKDVSACYACNADMGEGMTGLSGQSNQRFVDVPAFDLDHSKATVITLRLVEDKNGSAVDARPLVSHGNPIPPAVA